MGAALGYSQKRSKSHADAMIFCTARRILYTRGGLDALLHFAATLSIMFGLSLREAYGEVVGPEIVARIDLTFAIVPITEVDSVLAAAVWQRNSGRVFAAQSCLRVEMRDFASGCLDPSLPQHLVVHTTPIFEPTGDQASLDKALNDLQGLWKGGDYVLRIDPERALANVDRERSFQWERFSIKEFSGRTMTFSVGNEIFDAKFSPDSLVLTSTSFRGERVLVRDINR